MSKYLLEFKSFKIYQRYAYYYLKETSSEHFLLVYISLHKRMTSTTSSVNNCLLLLTFHLKKKQLHPDKKVIFAENK